MINHQYNTMAGFVTSQLVDAMIASYWWPVRVQYAIK